MTDFTPDAVPALPLAALREALGRADLESAGALLDAHDRAVRQALSPDALPDTRQQQAWLNLVSEHQAALAELGQLRDNVAQQLQQLHRYQRGANAYHQALE